MLATLFGLTLVGGFFAGLLGVGGAVLLIPLMLSIPPLVGVGELTMGEVSGLTMVQVLAASLTGWLSHRRGGFAHMPTILAIGIPMGVCSFAGAALSRSMSDQSMLIVFGVLVVVAFVLLLKRSTGEADDMLHFDFNHVLSTLCGGCVGLLAGIVGAGGGFMMVPVMVRILKIPMRVAIGSSLGIVFIGALMGSVGKMLTLQVRWVYLLPVIAGSLPSSLLGARVSKQLRPAKIRRILTLLVLAILLKTWFDILHPYCN